MATDDKSKLDNAVRIYKYGDLNPTLANSSQEVHDAPDGNIMSAVRQVVRKSYTPDARQGTGPYRGVVLRKNNNISSSSTTPAQSWMANVFSFGSSGLYEKFFGASLDQMPYELESYQVYIPELMTNLPRIKKYVPVGVDDPEHKKINLYPTFIAKDFNVPSAKEGDIVWVDYGNRVSFEDPIYLGPVFPTPVADESSGVADSTGAKEAMKKPVYCGTKPNPVSGKDILNRTPQNSTQTTSGTAPMACETEEVLHASVDESPPTAKPKIKKVKVNFDRMRYDHAADGGYPITYIRKDVAKDIISVKDIVNNLGGVLGTSGASRLLGNYDPKNTNRSTTSFHYTNMAFDIYTAGGSLHPRSNPQACEYVIAKSTERNSSGRYYFDIWAKSDKPNAEYKGYKVQRTRLDALTCPRGHSGRAKTVSVTGHYINLWEILKDHGFNRITGRGRWYNNCSSGAASEWWHMQSHRRLIEGESKWEVVLKTSNPDKRVEKSPVYKHKNRVFRGKGFSKG